ncbi:MAG: hypothetical protein KatS3mg131_3431 [Candidatus Tectimicrobiota bacterium]|nr:MAG: hypothetical protein KatS3mg131_3431 [Candidatus Tectomicrobia bacterium]
MAVEVCFTPQAPCASRILREIARARSEILVAVYALTSEELAWVLVKAARRGVQVRVVLDRDVDREQPASQGNFLQRHGVAVRRVAGLPSPRSAGSQGRMHQKFAVLDRQVVLTGSYNWTLAAERLNDENLLIFRDAGPLAAEYRREFFRLWRKGE